MAEVVTFIDKRIDLTTVVAKGVVTAEDILDWVDEYYDNDVTRLMLMDYTEADVSSMNSEVLFAINKRVKTRCEGRIGGKTALLFATEYDFGTGNMYSSLADIEVLPIQYKAFKELGQAKKWLGITAD